MAEQVHYPPQEEAGMAIGSIPGFRVSPGAVVAIEGPVSVGPEEAGAVLILAGTLCDRAKADLFWLQVASTARAARGSVGFLRLLAFADGPVSYAVAFWRTPEDAQAFARGPAHRAAVADLYRTGSQYSQFAGIWKAASTSGRRYFCDVCGAMTAAPATACGECGQELIDVYRMQGEPAIAG